MDKLPSVSIVIPVYNSEKDLPYCLSSIRGQDYPRDKVEIVVIDGGSRDGTVEIAGKFKVDMVLPNPLRTGEAGKAAGVKAAKNEIIAFIDSDNILPSPDWLRRMVKPFEDGEIVGTEPLYYSYRREDGYITRYCALMGMNDPLCLFIGNYDRFCYITNKWTEVELKQEDAGDYLKVELNGKQLPTIGANGFLVRRELFKKYPVGDYLFDIDVVHELVGMGFDKFAKVKIGIVHTFSGNIWNFAKKQRRRIKDYGYYKKAGLRKYAWSEYSKLKILKFIFYTVFIIPLIIQSIKGWSRKRDNAWLFHVAACWITLIVYASETIRNLIKTGIEDRDKW